jgi:hypothetical protein
MARGVLSKVAFALTVIVFGAAGASQPAEAAKKAEKSEKDERVEGCAVRYKGKHTAAGLFCDDGALQFETTWQHTKDMVRIEDTSLRKPLGGKRSLPNKVVEKVIKKPAKAVAKVFGW